MQEDQQKLLDQLEFEQLDSKKKLCQKVTSTKLHQLADERARPLEHPTESVDSMPTVWEIRHAELDSMNGSDAFSDQDHKDWIRLKLKRLEAKRLEMQNDGKDLEEADQKELLQLKLNVLLIQKVTQKDFSQAASAQLEESVLDRLKSEQKHSRAKEWWTAREMEFALEYAQMRVFERKLTGNQLKGSDRKGANELQKKLLYKYNIKSKLTKGTGSVNACLSFDWSRES